MIKFFPSYVGSKAYWVSRLENEFKGRDFIELFSGSAVLSANLAKTAILNDSDYYVYLILKNFDSLIVPDSFTSEDYLRVRKQADWWKYAFCLQSMSFSGVFRYSKNGYNVPLKHKNTLQIKDRYNETVHRWKDLNPVVTNQDYQKLSPLIQKKHVLILDPPYQKGKACYNLEFDYHMYWEFVRLNENAAQTIIIFDFVENLPFSPIMTKTLRVNGARPSNLEGYFKLEDKLREGQRGEDEFYRLYQNNKFLGEISRTDGLKGDFISNYGKIELKSDYYNPTKTPNFFIEKYSNHEKLTDGGPWQAKNNNCKYYIYFFVKTGDVFLFETEKLIERLESLKNLELKSVANKTWTTKGYAVNRQNFSDLFKIFKFTV